MNSIVDLNWLRNQIVSRSGLSRAEAGEIVRINMVAGSIIGLAPQALCFSKDITRFHPAENGLRRNFEIPKEFWNFLDVDWGENNPCFHFYPDHSIWVISSIKMDRALSYDFLRSQDPLLKFSTLTTKEIPTVPNGRKNRSGRPPKYDWNKCLIEAVRWMSSNGRPRTLTELVDYMAGWFEPDEPGDTQLKEYLGPLYDAFNPDNHSA